MIGSENFESFYIINLLDGSLISLFCVPENVNESYASRFENTDIPGRTSSYFGYEGTDNPSVSFSVKIHDDYCGKVGITHVTDYFKSLVYPDYTNRVISPVCKVVLGKQLSFKGICESVDINWSLPLRDGKYVTAEVSFSFKVVLDKSPTFKDIKGGRLI